MFYAIKEQNFNIRDKRKKDRLEAEIMEEELRMATEKIQRQDKVDEAPSWTPKSRIVTPGSRQDKTSRRRGFGI